MPHPDEGDLRALLDGAAGRMERVRLRAHLWRCARCRALFAEVRDRGARVAALLDRAPVEFDLDEAWQRVQVRRAPRAPRVIVPAFSFLGGGLVGALGLALAVVHGGILAPIQPPPPLSSGGVVLRDHCCSDRDGDGVADDGLLVLNDGARGQLTLSYRDLDGSGGLSEGDLISPVRPTPTR